MAALGRRAGTSPHGLCTSDIAKVPGTVRHPDMTRDMTLCARSSLAKGGYCLVWKV